MRYYNNESAFGHHPLKEEETMINLNETGNINKGSILDIKRCRKMRDELNLLIQSHDNNTN